LFADAFAAARLIDGATFATDDFAVVISKDELEFCAADFDAQKHDADLTTETQRHREDFNFCEGKCRSQRVSRIKLTTMCPDWPWARQTPGGQGQWGDAEFIIDQHGTDADWWFVYDDMPAEEATRICSGAAVLITPEPPALKKYPQKYLEQFDWVITSDRGIDHQGRVLRQQGLPWHVGRTQTAGRNISFSKDYDELKSLWPIPKTKLISAIASDKRHTPGHRARCDFVERLKRYFGESLDVFGWGGREIPDKWDGIASYRYHIAIENSAQADYWTEKLSDAYLAGAFPIYFGAPNIADYFPADSIRTIEINDPQGGIRQIEEILRTDPFDPEKLKVCRDLVLDKYNLFALMADFISDKGSGQMGATTRKLAPVKEFQGSAIRRRLAGLFR
jgi:hypothetical protein